MHNELTKQDIRKLEEEIEYRKLVVRPQALEDVKEARAHGDLSENFEYHAAKKVKNQNESRIRYLERMIKTAVIVSDESAEDQHGIAIGKGFAWSQSGRPRSCGNGRRRRLPCGGEIHRKYGG